MNSYLTFLSRNKLYTAIVSGGLSLALAFVVLLVSYASTEYRVGKNVPDYKNLYAIGTGDYLGMTAGTAKAFFPSMPEIKEWTRFGEYYEGSDAVVNGNYFQAKCYAIDPNFMQMMGIKCEGTDGQRVLTDEQHCLVSRSFARKAFGMESPIGKTIKCDTLQFKVAGVVDDMNKEDVLFPCDVYVSMSFLDKVMKPMDNFGVVCTIVRLAEGTDAKKENERLLDKYMDYWKDFYVRDNDGKSFIWGSSLVRMDKLYFCGIESMGFRQGNKSLVNILLVVALVLLFSAIFNYINLTVAQIGRRAREMCTRRLMGESVAGLFARYLRESAFFTLLCFVLGGVLAWTFKSLFDSMLDTKIMLMASVQIWGWLLLAYIIVTLLSGIIPAAIVSRFSPIDAVRGTIRLRSKMWMNKGFIVAQNVISMVLVALAVTMMLQMNHMVNMPLGYNTKDLLTFRPGVDEDKMQVIVDHLRALHDVETVTTTLGTPLRCGANGVHDDNGNVIGSLRLCGLDSTAMRLLDIKVVEQYGQPVYGKVYLAESAKRALGVSASHPYFGQRREDGSHEVEVCGIVRDYHTGDALSVQQKAEYNSVMLLEHGTTTFVILVKTRGDHNKALQAIRDECQKTMKQLTGVPKEFDIKYMDDELTDGLKVKHNTMVLILTFMLISIFISGLGLFGMSVYYTQQQQRHIAIRKVMGASVKDAAWQLSRPFLWSTIVAVVIAIPISAKLMAYYLQDFPYRIDFPWWVIPMSAVFTLIVVTVSIVSRTLHAALANPVESLKTE